MSLSEKALLVQLTISQWTARKFDKRRSQEIADVHGVDTKVGRYNKVLLPGTDALEDIHRKSGVIRAAFYKNTLPWSLDGSAILPSANYIDFTSMMRKEKNEWVSLVDNFVFQYPFLLEAAKKNLRDMFDPADYPPADCIKSKFNIDLAVFPVPSTDLRVSIGQDDIDAITADIEARVQQAGASAMREVWSRLFDRVQLIHTKLADPSAIFRDSLIENARETCDLMKRLNFNNDPDLELMRLEVESKLASCVPDSLRVDPDYRNDTADEAKRIMDKMRHYMGG